jgi:L-lactate dehydrogenase (cytochrome)
VKGQIRPDDARRAVDLGIDGIHLSNHGGRQLDRAPATIDLVSPLRAALGDRPTIVLDSGVRHGSDIAMAIALGADLCAIGRPYLYGLAAGGERGVGHVLDLLISQLRRTMQLLGVTSMAALRAAGEDVVRVS